MSGGVRRSDQLSSTNSDVHGICHLTLSQTRHMSGGVRRSDQLSCVAEQELTPAAVQSKRNRLSSYCDAPLRNMDNLSGFTKRLSCEVSGRYCCFAISRHASTTLPHWSNETLSG